MKHTLTSVTNAMFVYRKQWITIPDEAKEQFFFIINRYLSKIYPEQAQLLNDKSIDKIMALDIWYAFMMDKPYPDELWSKAEDILPKKDIAYHEADYPDTNYSETEKKSKKILISHKDLLNLQSNLQITTSEMEILVKYHDKEVKDEIKYLKQQQNE